MSRFELKTSLTAAQTVELLLDEEYSLIKGDHPQFKLANDLYEGLIEEYEVAINCAEKSVLNITLPSVLGVSSAQASKQSLSAYFKQLNKLEYAELLISNSNYHSTDTNQVTQKQPHGNAVRNSKKREEILEFAIYTMKNFPEQCQSATKWAETIDEKARLKWPETGEPPLNRTTIEKLIGKALKL
ncbi:hypothetical protein [Shewanella ulleungensis]|uniref:hypothetical protein n=1 Tax=Shewanella ulleungensis TaxID=2282699 RepID=UPI003D7B315E